MEVTVFQGPAGGRHLSHSQVGVALQQVFADNPGRRIIVGFDFPFSFVEHVRCGLAGDTEWRSLVEYVAAHPEAWHQLKEFADTRREVEKITSAANPTLVNRQPYTGRQAWTGMDFLSQYLEAPISILPMWEKPQAQTVFVEVYPKVFSRSLRKTKDRGREAAVGMLEALPQINLSEAARGAAKDHDGPFDALAVVFGMWQEEVKLGLSPEMMTQRVKEIGLAKQGWIYGVPWGLTSGT